MHKFCQEDKNDVCFIVDSDRSVRSYCGNMCCNVKQRAVCGATEAFLMFSSNYLIERFDRRHRTWLQAAA